MSAKPLRRSSSQGPGEGNGKAPWLYGMAWACLPVMLTLSALVLIFFGFSWWTALTVVFLLACPASAAVAIYFGWRPFPDVPRPDRRG